jgi:prepilin-type N-terminal cleavage/methylation domain-containing protein
MFNFKLPRKNAFSLIELLVASTIIVILVSVAGTNVGSVRLKSRNASRQDSVHQYRSTLELYKSSRGNYFIYTSKKGSTPSTQVCTPAYDASLASGHYYALYGDNSVACTGYMTTSTSALGGGGQGRMTRRGGAGGVPLYSPNSIADALVDEGFLTSVHADPLTKSFYTSSADKKDDFILTLCKEDGSEPKVAAEASQFSIYAHLEGAVDANQVYTAQQSCGGPRTNYGRFTIQ